METNKLKVSLKNIAMLKQEIRNFNVNGTGFVQMIRKFFLMKWQDTSSFSALVAVKTQIQTSKWLTGQQQLPGKKYHGLEKLTNCK